MIFEIHEYINGMVQEHQYDMTSHELRTNHIDLYKREYVQDNYYKNEKE